MEFASNIYQSLVSSEISTAQLEEQLSFVLNREEFTLPGERYSGKVRDSYRLGDRRLLITSDRLSCFDVIVTTIPFKGQVLNQLAVDWFKKTSDIVQNHLLDVPHPNVMLVQNCEILPIEVVMRGYLTGSAWRDYQAGNAISGIQLPPGMKKSQKFEKPLLTPSTKAPSGSHDLPISEHEIVKTGIVSERIWGEVREISLNLFMFATQQVANRGLILVDTKYEFGLLNGKVVLADEVHTLDSSRYWKKDSYQAALDSGKDPANLDKEPTRQWLLSNGYQGNGPIPKFSDQHRVAIARHYISSFEQITGQTFSGMVGPVKESIELALKRFI